VSQQDPKRKEPKEGGPAEAAAKPVITRPPKPPRPPPPPEVVPAHVARVAKSSQDFSGPLLSTKGPALNPDPLGPPTSSGPFELVPGFAPGAIGLSRALGLVGAESGPASAIIALMRAIESSTGLRPSEAFDLEMTMAALTNGIFTVPLMQLSELCNSFFAKHRFTGFPRNAPPRQNRLPAQFDFADLPSLQIPRAQLAMSDISDVLRVGELPSPTPGDRLLRNQVMAEILHRLSENLNQPGAFSVVLHGQTHASLDSLFIGLSEASIDISVRFTSRVADIFPLHFQVGEKLVPVPIPLLIQTGLTDVHGNEALVPATHSEMLIATKGRLGNGMSFDSACRFVHSTEGVGFFAAETTAPSAWLGGTKSNLYSGENAMRAIGAAASVMSTMQTMAAARQRRFDSAGVSLCNDVIALLEQVVTGRTQQYPLLLDRTRILDELTKREGRWAQLAEVFSALPSDASTGKATVDAVAQARRSAATRALASMPWPKGREAVYSSVEARRILEVIAR
jgi:hypothetical protein